MALTLVEAAKAAANGGLAVESAIIQMFAEKSDILRVLPFESINGNAYRYTQEGALPAVAFRGVNEGYTASEGVLNPQVEPLIIAGGELDVDKFIVNTQGAGVRSTHEAMKVKSLAASITTTFVKGDQSTSPREFDGLQKRVIGGQLIAAGATANGTALSLAKLDEAIDAVDSPTHLLMSKALRRRLTTAARTPSVSGTIDFVLDEFGKKVTTYNGIPILLAYSGNGGTEPLAFNEAATSGTATGTSIYVLSMNPGMVQGIQSGPMMVQDLGELQTAPVFRTRVEWYMGVCILHGRAVSRLWSIADAAVTA